VVQLEQCPWCYGAGSASAEKGPCPACGGEKLVTRRVAKAIEGLKEENLAGRRGANQFAFDVIAGLRKADRERTALADIPVPASFTKEKPDTPESKAARVQLLQHQGMDIVQARQKVYGK